MDLFWLFFSGRKDYTNRVSHCLQSCAAPHLGPLKSPTPLLKPYECEEIRGINLPSFGIDRLRDRDELGSLLRR